MAAIPPDQNDNQAPTLLAVIWVVATISTILAACRLFTRFKILKTAGKDEIALIISVVKQTWSPPCQAPHAELTVRS